MFAGFCQEDTPLTRDEVRAAAKRVTPWHDRFGVLFGRREAREHALVYTKGLLSDQKRKSVEPMALQFTRSREGGPATQDESASKTGRCTWGWRTMKRARGAVGIITWPS